MTARTGEQLGDLEARLETPLPDSLPQGRATAVFCFGTCFHPTRQVRRIEISVDGVRHPVSAQRMPRPDAFGAYRVEGAYRSGFWATVPVAGSAERIELQLEAVLDDGSVATSALGTIEVVEARASASARPGLIAVCMATYDPDMTLFETQIESLRAQTHADWVCVISDDCSPPERFAQIEALVAEDERFTVSRSDRRLGFYRNFERALELVPAEAALVALSDQDDRWYPDKLEALRDALGDAQLAYSDQRLVSADGRVTAETIWAGRRRNDTNLASLMIANTIGGASTLFRRELLDVALPFPEGPGWEFHDHWIAQAALATGTVAYVDRPLYDYVQHAGAILGQAAVSDAGSARRRLFRGWRPMYFCGYIPLELHARVLLARCAGTLAADKRRTLERLAAADRSPAALAWLAARPLRELAGRNETLGTETLLARGILWRHVATAAAHVPRRTFVDASLPGCGPDKFEQRRLRRWLARR